MNKKTFAMTVIFVVPGGLPGIPETAFLRHKTWTKTGMGLQKKMLTVEQALQKMRHYCAYQERCHSEVREKLYALGVWKKDHDLVTATLIEEGYLNEERFAIAYAGGKFRLKQWGRVKIGYALKQKQVSDYSIKKALKQISHEDYLSVLRSLAEKKYESLKQEQWMVRRKKTLDYLLQHGFETELINGVLQGIIKKKDE